MLASQPSASFRTIAVPLALSLLAPLLALPANSQQAPEPYSHSAEYRQMLEELRKPSPSPAMIAIGHLPQADPALKLTIEESAASLTITSPAAVYSFDKQSAELSVRNRATETSWIVRLPAFGGAASVTRSGNDFTLSAVSNPNEKATLHVLSDGLARLDLQAAPTAKELGFAVFGGGAYLGLGERFWQAGLQGTQLDVRPQDRYGEPGHNWTYVAIPFVYSTGGLGLYADTAFDTRFAFVPKGESFEVKVAAGTVPLYLFTDASPKAVLSAYTAVTGRPQNPPQWTFGPWITSLGGKGAVLDYARRIRVEGMPASALWIYDEMDDANNLGWPFWFNSFYGDPRKFSDTLHGMGFRVMTYVHPYVRQQILPYPVASPNYDKAVANKWVMTDAQGQPAGPRFEDVTTGQVDFTNPAAVDWWQGMITHAVRDQGFDGWMEDFGEWVRDSDHLAGGSGLTMSELYPLFYHKVTIRAAQAANPEVAPFARSGAPGSQAFSTVMWGADQFANWSRDYGLPSVVTAGITAGMSGFSTWGPDIMSAGDNEELWMRWVEFGALSPVMRDHVWNRPDRSFNVWTNADTTAHFRRYAVLHSSLLPYFTHYAEEAHRTGVPIMRHLMLEYPDDPRSATAEYEYLLGEQMLVAPVVQPGARERTFYVPAGEWINFWNGDSFAGGQDATVNAGTDTIPILVRAGSILPFKPEAEAGRWDWNDARLLEGSLVWHAYISESGKASGQFRLANGTSATFEQADGAATITGKSAGQRDYEVIVRSRLVPHGVLLNGRPLAEYTVGVNGRASSQWWWNPSGNEVHVLFHAADFKVEIQGLSATQYSTK